MSNEKKPLSDQPFSPKVYEDMLADMSGKELVAEFEMVVGDAAYDAAKLGSNAGKNNDRVRIARKVLGRRLTETEGKAAA